VGESTRSPVAQIRPLASIRSMKTPSRGATSLAAAALALCGTSALGSAQTFVERSLELGLVHHYSTGLDRVGSLAPMADWTQQGIALGDLDNDGDPDLITVARMLPNHVFRNDGGTFTDLSAVSQIDTDAFDNCVALGDYDRDGDLDLFIGALAHGQGGKPGRGRLYRNDGGFVFTDVTQIAGTIGRGHTMGAAWMDLDRDGLLDLYCCEFMGTPDAYYRNNGDGTFQEIAAQIGLATGGSTHVVAHYDSDLDGYYDVFPGTDWFVSNAANLLNNQDDVHLQGQADGTFLDVTANSSYSKAGPPNFGSATMGIAVGDVDYDGDFDMYQTQVDFQFLMINNGWPGSGVRWLKAETAYGVSNQITNTPTGTGQTVGWGCHFFDADNDVWLDLFKVNGHVSQANPRNQQNYLFRGLGPAADFAFEDVSVASGLATFYDARGIAAGDIDQDGDVDLFTAEVAGRLRYYENQTDPAGQGWLVVRPVTTTSAPGGVGTVISWTDLQGFPHKRAIGADGTTAGQNERLARFGLGTETAVDVSVAFPSGVTRVLSAVPANTDLTVVEPELIRVPRRVLPTARVLPEPVTFPGGFASPAIFDPASQRFRVIAFAHDAAGNALDGNAVVTIEIPGLEAAGPVQHVSGNKFTRQFQLPVDPGAHRVEVSFDGFEVRVRPTIAFRGPAATTVTSGRVVPEAVRAGSADTFEVVVTPRDARGQLPAGVGTVQVQGGAALPLSSLTAVGDGSFRATFPAPVAAGIYPLTVFVDGLDCGTKATLHVGGTAFSNNTLIYQEVPAAAWALMPHQQKMLVTPRDLLGRRLGPECQVSMTIILGQNSVPVTNVTSPHIAGRVDGDFLFVIEKPVGSPANSANGILGFTIDGTVMYSKSFSF
jgi:hypothetical protein